MKKAAYIFDIDGTLANCSHRLHFLKPPKGAIHFNLNEVDWKPDWDSFYAACVDDKPIEDVILLCRLLDRPDITIIFLTGRPKSIATQTCDWLQHNVVSGGRLYMRDTGDHRPDYKVKREIYETKIKNDYNVVGVFEDRQQCVDMWRGLGLTCFQVADGNY